MKPFQLPSHPFGPATPITPGIPGHPGSPVYMGGPGVPRTSFGGRLPTQPFSQPAALSDKLLQLLAQPVESFRPVAAGPAAGPKTYAALLLDESSSMARHRASALEGFNAQVEVIRTGAKQAGNTAVSLTAFNALVRPVLANRPASELRPLSPDQYVPNGGTALFDAIGQTLEALLEQPDIHASQTAVLVAIFTDGEENSSRRFNGQTLKEIVTRLEATGRWTFTLMGPHGTSVELASILNLQAGNVAAFNPQDGASTEAAFASMTRAATSYMSLRSQGVMASASLYASPDTPDILG